MHGYYPARSWKGHWASHRLNLAIVLACNIQAFKNVESYIGEIARFFGYSAKRQRLLDKCMEKVVPEAKAKKLKENQMGGAY